MYLQGISKGNHRVKICINWPILAVGFQIGTYDLPTVLTSFWSIKKVFALEVKLTLPPCTLLGW